MCVVELLGLSWLLHNDVSIWPIVLIEWTWCWWRLVWSGRQSEWLKLSWFRVELRLSSRSFSTSAVQGASEAKLLNCWWFCTLSCFDGSLPLILILHSQTHSLASLHACIKHKDVRPKRRNWTRTRMKGSLNSTCRWSDDLLPSLHQHTFLSYTT